MGERVEIRVVERQALQVRPPKQTVAIRIPGPRGPHGLSAFDLAVEEGFGGTEAEWLESLQGEAGVGTPGLSAYQVALANGFVGSQAAWLASLEGEPGAPSTVPGPPGVPAQFFKGPTPPTAPGEYVWVETDGNGNFIDMHTGVNP